MRDLKTIIKRIEADLPVTEGELELARRHIEKCQRSQDRFHAVLIIISLLFVIWAIIYRFG